MRRLGGLALACLALAAALAGCTGTSETTAPYLLVVGLDDPSATPAGPQLALVEDQYSPLQATTERLTLVAGSRRALPYPAVGSDVTHRAGARERLAVLTRDLGGGAAPASALLFFDLADIDPTNPVAFAPSATPGTLQLTGAGGILESVPGVSGAPCPSAVQVSTDGSLAAILDDRGACSGNANDLVYLYLVDVAARTASVVLPSAPLLPAGPYLDQADGDEHLYFLEEGIDSARLFRMTLPDGNPGPYQSVTLKGTNQRVLTGTSATLVALRPGQLEAVDPASTTTVTNVATVSGSHALAVDPTTATSQILVLGTSQSAVHADAADDKPVKLEVTGVAGAIDPVNRFAYELQDGGVVAVLDLLQIAGGGSGAPFRRFSVPELVLPRTAAGDTIGVLSWARAALPPATP